MGFEEIHWANGGYWWLLLVPLLLGPAWAWLLYRRAGVVESLGGRSLLPRMTDRPATARRIASAICVFLALELMAVALLRPRYGLREVTIYDTGIDLCIVLDASRSMKAQDLSPDRISAATVEITRLLDRIPGNHVCLVPFAGIAFVQTPLTSDFQVVKEYLADLKVTDLPVAGTALGRALRMAMGALGVKDGKAPKGSKALVVFSDGENHEGEPLEVASELARAGIKVFTVGVGTPSGQPIPVLDDAGRVTGTAREKDGKTPLLSKLNEDLLKELANRTGGTYLALTGGSDVAEGLAREIAAMEKSAHETQLDRLREDRFQYPLGASLVFWMASLLLLGGGRGGRRATLAAGAILLLALPAQARGLFEKEHGGVADALALLASGQSGDAAKALSELESELTGRPDYWFDVALAREAAGQLDEAVSAIDSALKALAIARESRQDWPTQARILHAKGTILARQGQRMAEEKKPGLEVRKKYREAVEALTEALLLDPDAEDTRRNLELAAMAAYPPCAKLDDKYEPDDTAEEAKFLTPDPNSLEFREELLLCPRNEDWYRLPLNAGETLIASVEKPGAPGEGAANPEGEGKEPASVDLTLLDETGNPLRGPGKQALFRAAGGATQVRLRVIGPEDEDGIPYVLVVRVVPPCPAGDDAMEDNDTRETAKPLSDGDHSLRACPGDDDYFSYTEKKDAQKQIVLRVPQGEGPLMLEVLLADGAPLDIHSQSGENGEVLSALLPKAEQDAAFSIRVGGGREGFYSLSVQDPQGEGGGQNPDPKKEDSQPQQKPEERKGSQTLRELLDAIDRNDENLEAKEAMRNSPYREYVPEKDW